MSMLPSQYSTKELELIQVSYNLFLEYIEPVLKECFFYDTNHLHEFCEKSILEGIAYKLKMNTLLYSIDHPEITDMYFSFVRKIRNNEEKLRKEFSDDRKREIAKDNGIVMKYSFIVPKVDLSDKDIEEIEHKVQITLDAIKYLDEEEKKIRESNHFDLFFDVPDKDLLKTYFIMDDNRYEYLYYCLLFPIHLYCSINHLNADNAISESDYAELSQEAYETYLNSDRYYEQNAYPDLLRLLTSHNNFTIHDTVTIKIRGKSIKLDNKEQWIYYALRDLFDKLEMPNMEVAKKELQGIINENIKQVGRKSLNKFQILFIRGIDNLWSYIFETEVDTNDKCRLIYRILKHIGLPISEELEDENMNDDIKNIRSKLKYLRNNDINEQWFTINETPNMDEMYIVPKWKR